MHYHAPRSGIQSVQMRVSGDKQDVMRKTQDMLQDNRAPRFRMFLERKIGALIMKKCDWELLIKSQRYPVEIDVSATPMATILHDAPIVASFAERSEGEGLIKIFRNDPKDTPRHINVDNYRVWERLDLHLDYEQTVKGCDTLDDSMLRGFLSDYVFIVPVKKGADHHLLDVPAKYKVIMKEEKTAS